MHTWSPIFSISKAKKHIFPYIRTLTAIQHAHTQVASLQPVYIVFFLKIKKCCQVSMSRHDIHDPWPSIYWKRFKSTLQFYLEAINWAISKPWRSSSYWEQRHYGEISPQLSLHPFVLESLNFLCSTPKLFLSCDGEPHWLLHVRFPLRRIEVVEAQLEGLSFSVPICVVTKKFHLCNFVDYINRNTLFSSNWYIVNICITFHGNIFLFLLMDYDNLYANIIYHFHMLVYLGCWG